MQVSTGGESYNSRVWNVGRSGDGVGCLEVKVGANAVQLTDVGVAGLRVMISGQRR